MRFNVLQPKIISMRAIHEGEMLPRGYGVAWYVPWNHQVVCLPIPFNKIVGAFRAWYVEWHRPCENDPLKEIYAKGIVDGQKQSEQLIENYRKRNRELLDIRNKLIAQRDDIEKAVFDRLYKEVERQFGKTKE